ncbi:hypothetical protein E2C01_032907 [Portunus trituberculatus]|uniref:Uncharacterized protein n=1 Tax=Portunus trituberculatus TaxID=210409 RepID=A0A5B7F2R2_PORTR|nr:hypothetical protein [Portunus trituberculatus]
MLYHFKSIHVKSRQTKELCWNRGQMTTVQVLYITSVVYLHQNPTFGHYQEHKHSCCLYRRPQYSQATRGITAHLVDPLLHLAAGIVLLLYHVATRLHNSAELILPCLNLCLDALMLRLETLSAGSIPNLLLRLHGCPQVTGPADQVSGLNRNKREFMTIAQQPHHTYMSKEFLEISSSKQLLFPLGGLILEDIPVLHHKCLLLCYMLCIASRVGSLQPCRVIHKNLVKNFIKSCAGDLMSDWTDCTSRPSSSGMDLNFSCILASASATSRLNLWISPAASSFWSRASMSSASRKYSCRYMEAISFCRRFADSFCRSFSSWFSICIQGKYSQHSQNLRIVAALVYPLVM